jgi:hypothetical protein
MGCSCSGGPREFLDLAEGRGVPRVDGTGYSSHWEGIGWEGNRYRWEDGDRAIEGERGRRKWTEDKRGALVTYREEGRGEGRARGTRTLSRRSHFVFSDRRQPTGHARFDTPRFIHSARPRGFQPQESPQSLPSH